MNSQQYEELCRFFLAHKLGVDIEQVKSVRIPNPTRPGLPQYSHQIDLYWETEGELCLYLHIANAKWRENAKVDQDDVLLLQQVKQKVAAHKAMMLTNLDYTTGAVSVAKDEGIALHIVRPNFESNILPTQDRNIIYAKLRELATVSSRPVFLHEIAYKAFDFRDINIQTQFPSNLSTSPNYQTKTVSGYETKVRSGFSNKANTTSRRSGDIKPPSKAPETKSGGPSKTK